MPTLQDVQRQALQLKPSLRRKLLSRIEDSLPPPNAPMVTKALLDRRFSELATGKVKGISIEESRRRMRKIVGR